MLSTLLHNLPFNIKLIEGSIINILFDEEKVKGTTYISNDKTYTLKCKKYCFKLWYQFSSCILQRSGIGSKSY